MPALRVGARLSEQLADALALSIRDGQLSAGQKLPTEQALVERFGVSRTVVREALSRLKTLGLIESRQGSGAYIKTASPQALSQLAFEPDGSLDAVIQMVEVRRALEAESAALAAARRTPQSVKQIRQALQALAKAVRQGGDGVQEDVAFHTAIAQASRNPFLLATLAYLNRFLLDATRVTRANEATRADLEAEVHREHSAIVAAIDAGDVAAARQAGAAHMVNAARRIGQADPAFWARHGQQLADRLRAELGQPQPAAASRRR
ncbi:FadR family transcriptional regulator [Ideonella sp. 4Y16]|uniref:FadR family transcriptional regulator n=2 Tax=Ideonella alba TaxID=2824118 RepID=A0A940Y861_9BURK|nr:FadR family transcriptional regulator [Ideonella alba]MBQ0941733.1 FadR family transcriptional regulator [Ideonella alba]